MTRALAAAAAGVALALVAAAFGVTSLYVPGIALALAGVVGAAWVWLATRGARVVRVARSSTVEEGARYEVEVRVERAVGGVLDDPLLERPLRRPRGRLLLAATFQRRGRHLLAPSTLTVRDPLGLAERRICSDEHELLVLPRVEPVVAGPLDGGRAGSRESRRAAPRDAALEFDSLRPYRVGTPASRIHWPTVARSGTMMERRLVSEVDPRPLVVVDAARPDSADALDRALRAAASLTVHLARAGGCALLLPGDRRPAAVDPDLRAWPALHARLALVDAGVETASSRIERGGVIVWVRASSGPAPAALAAAVAPVRYLVVPASAPTRTAAFTTAGCSAYELRGARSAA